MPKTLEPKDLQALLESGTKPVVLDFYADWCGPCRMQAPLFAKAEEALGDRADFVKVNTDDAPELSRRFAVMTIPTIVVQHGGKTCYKNVGVTDVEDIVEAVEAALAQGASA